MIDTSGTKPTPQTGMTPEEHGFTSAQPRPRHFTAIWLIPIVAALLAGYLGWNAYAQHGPMISITFKSARGLVPGQTQVRYKFMTIGTLESIALAKDRATVTADIRMAGQARDLLTENARFWVIYPQFNTLNLSDFQTLVSGSYIELDPGAVGGSERRAFAGLDAPPFDRTDEPGRVFTLKVDDLGALNVGTPIYFREIEVGEVLSYNLGSPGAPITVQIFVNAPYDAYVKPHTVFWNASGLTASFGPNGFHVETKSLRAVMGGGVSFATPAEDDKVAPVEAGTVYSLYADKKTADTAQYQRRLPYVTYFNASVKNLAVGAAVQIYGLSVGEVTEVKLVPDANGETARVRVAFTLEPERVFGADTVTSKGDADAGAIMARMVAAGMRVKMEANDFISGQKLLTLEFAPDLKAQNAEDGKTTLAQEGDALVLPSAGGGGDNVLDAVGALVNKLNQIPFTEIGSNLNHLLAGADKIVNGADMQQTLKSLSETMVNAEQLTREANKNMTPALQKLPQISDQLQTAVSHANALLDSLDQGYGDGSDFQRGARRALDQANDAARSVRLLADFLNRHPEALITGKSGGQQSQSTTGDNKQTPVPPLDGGSKHE